MARAGPPTANSGNQQRPPRGRHRSGASARRLARPAAAAAASALLIGVWSIATARRAAAFPARPQTWDAAVELFADPFYRNGPNDQGIGWNILSSLQRVGIGFGLAALVGIPLGFMHRPLRLPVGA